MTAYHKYSEMSRCIGYCLPQREVRTTMPLFATDPFTGSLAIGIGLVTVVLMIGLRNRRKQLPLPPGPPRQPIVGNLLNVPKEFEWLTNMRWGKELSELGLLFSIHE